MDRPEIRVIDRVHHRGAIVAPAGPGVNAQARLVLEGRVKLARWIARRVKGIVGRCIFQRAGSGESYQHVIVRVYGNGRVVIVTPRGVVEASIGAHVFYQAGVDRGAARSLKFPPLHCTVIPRGRAKRHRVGCPEVTVSEYDVDETIIVGLDQRCRSQLLGIGQQGTPA